ncbi:MAG: GNAT family N-acetyltransferase [Acidimicrobiales bacterium]
MVTTRLMNNDDATAVADLVTRRLRADARRNRFVNGVVDRPALIDSLRSVAERTWVAVSGGAVVGHLHGALLESDTFGHGAWIGPDGVTHGDTDVLADLYARAGRRWIDAGAREHFVWVLDRPERTAPWMELGFARMHQRGVRALDGAAPRPLPAGYTTRLGGPADLDWAVDLGTEIDRAQADGPSFSLDLAVDERAELDETLADPEVRYFLAERDGQPVGQCITFPLPERRGSFAATLHLSAVAVRESERGRGVATAMVDGALDRARRHGFRYVETNWRVTNRDAARYWTRYGFHPTYVRLHRTVGRH